uniref:Putative secreted protein n=1 Tax=Anopheles darlingi TaxID=43151 RepID=A0A2M4D2Z1_ANODA
MRQLRYVDAHVVVQLIFVLKVLPAHIALVLADGVVVVVLSLLLPWGLHRPDELFFGDFRHRAHIVLRVLFLHLDDEAFR